MANYILFMADKEYLMKRDGSAGRGPPPGVLWTVAQPKPGLALARAG